ncbi:hypothetical protein [Mycobacterium tilburgii]|nr:hypothetical protein [Mycobacterium tilburgii]
MTALVDPPARLLRPAMLRRAAGTRRQRNRRIVDVRTPLGRLAYSRVR